MRTNASTTVAAITSDAPVSANSLHATADTSRQGVLDTSKKPGERLKNGMGSEGFEPPIG